MTALGLEQLTAALSESIVAQRRLVEALTELAQAEAERAALLDGDARWVSGAELAEITGVSLRTITSLTHRPEGDPERLPSVKIGHLRRYPLPDVQEALRQRTRGTDKWLPNTLT